MILDRVEIDGVEWVLRRTGEHLEIIAGGTFLMSTDGHGASERRLVTEALAHRGPGAAVLIGGLGMGFSVAQALALGAQQVTVVELCAAVVDWHQDLLADVSEAVCADPRVEVLVGDLAEVVATDPRRWDAVCVDTDNGPDWLVIPANAWLYGAAGLSAAGRRLEPDGAVAFWSAAPSPAFAARLDAHFAEVRTVALPPTAAPDRADPDVVYVARTPRARPMAARSRGP